MAVQKITMYVNTLPMTRLCCDTGAAHVLFGSDYPVYDPAIVIEKIKSYPFTDKEKRLILGEKGGTVATSGLRGSSFRVTHFHRALLSVASATLAISDPAASRCWFDPARL
jgi:hypothetical protein